MSVQGELTVKVDKIRKQLLGLMKAATKIKTSIGALEHDEISLRSAISITLDDLERVDAQIRAMGPGPGGAASPPPTGEGSAA